MEYEPQKYKKNKNITQNVYLYIKKSIGTKTYLFFCTNALYYNLL
jgi:hypothetical protein